MVPIANCVEPCRRSLRLNKPEDDDFEERRRPRPEVDRAIEDDETELTTKATKAALVSRSEVDRAIEDDDETELITKATKAASRCLQEE